MSEDRREGWMEGGREGGRTLTEGRMEEKSGPFM